MDVLQIRGPSRLVGSVTVSGAKNAALPIMAASLLLDGPCEMERVPRLLDVSTQTRVLQALGMQVKASQGRLSCETIDPNAVVAPARLVRRMRASFCVLGPLVARRGRAVVALPGGCAIGPRPVDVHLRGLAALGADIRIQGGYVVARADRLRGRRINMAGPRGPSVTGTANVLMAAVLARGRTVLHAAACEPEIVDLGHFLNGAGARIRGLGTPVLEIDGVDQLSAHGHRIVADRIETATLLIAAAMTQGRVTVEGTQGAELAAVLDVLDDCGAEIVARGTSISIQGPSRVRPIRFVSLPHPGVPTDVQAQLSALATLADGASYVQDRVFPTRFAHVKQLARMGARIDHHGETLRMAGRGGLRGASVVATDLRASAALVLAGLAAEGTTTLHQIHHLDRGYESLDEKLRKLGGDVARVSEPRAHHPSRETLTAGVNAKAS